MAFQSHVPPDGGTMMMQLLPRLFALLERQVLEPIGLQERVAGHGILHSVSGTIPEMFTYVKFRIISVHFS